MQPKGHHLAEPDLGRAIAPTDDPRAAGMSGLDAVTAAAGAAGSLPLAGRVGVGGFRAGRSIPVPSTGRRGAGAFSCGLRPFASAELHPDGGGMSRVIAYRAGQGVHRRRGHAAPEGPKKMNPIKHFALPLALAATLAASAGAAALEPLGQNRYVTDRLVAARVADRIRKTCPDQIGARMIYAFSQAYALKGWAKDQGYSGDEIDRFLKDKAEKRRIYDRAEEYLSARGAVKGKVEGFCALGYKEIKANSLVGSLIYEK